MKKHVAIILFAAILLTGCSEKPEVSDDERKALEALKTISEVELPPPGRSKRIMPEDYEWRKVKRVIDADTLELKNGEKVRLIGVDTPEMKNLNKPVERFGKEAHEFVKKTLGLNKTVWLEYDQTKKDKYGRTLAYVHYYKLVEPEGRMITFIFCVLNEEIIRQGYARVDTSVPFRDMEKYNELEKEAREAKRGIWAEESEKDSQGYRVMDVEHTESTIKVNVLISGHYSKNDIIKLSKSLRKEYDPEKVGIIILFWNISEKMYCRLKEGSLGLCPLPERIYKAEKDVELLDNVPIDKESENPDKSLPEKSEVNGK